MTTPDTITRRRLYADCGQLRALTPFESALLRQPCADRRWDAAIDAEAARRHRQQTRDAEAARPTDPEGVTP